LYSKGKYVVISDPDDILSNNILRICYNYAEKYRYDFIRFNIYLGNSKLCLEKLAKNIEGNVIYQPELSTYIYYGNEEININDYYITNKFIISLKYIIYPFLSLYNSPKYFLNNTQKEIIFLIFNFY
jgi:hypothetical protein